MEYSAHRSIPRLGSSTPSESSSDTAGSQLTTPASGFSSKFSSEERSSPGRPRLVIHCARTYLPLMYPASAATPVRWNRLSRDSFVSTPMPVYVPLLDSSSPSHLRHPLAARARFVLLTPVSFFLRLTPNRPPHGVCLAIFRQSVSLSLPPEVMRRSLNAIPPDNQAKMQTEFRAAMAKLAVIGQNPAKMIDCSDVIPVPKPVVGKPHLPAGLSMADIEQAVSLPLSSLLH